MAGGRTLDTLSFTELSNWDDLEGAVAERLLISSPVHSGLFPAAQWTMRCGQYRSQPAIPSERFREIPVPCLLVPKGVLKGVSSSISTNILNT